MWINYIISYKLFFFSSLNCVVAVYFKYKCKIKNLVVDVF